MTTKRLLVMLALVLVLTGCTDPKRVEEANAIRRESEALYLATATHVAMQEELASVRLAATATAIADKEAVRATTQANRIARQKSVIRWSTVAGVVVILALAFALSIASIGGATAFAHWVRIRARLVWLSEATRTFPIYLDKGWLVDLEAGERARLNAPSQPHPGRLTGSIQARVIGLLAQSGVNIAKAAKDAQPGMVLPAIGQKVPLLESSWLPKLEGGEDRETN